MAWETQRSQDESRRQMPQITNDWVENYLLPILKDLSRRGVIVAYDSGIEIRSKSRENEQSPIVLADPRNAVTLTDMLTAVFSVTVNSGNMVAGRINYSVRASNGTDHQALIGHLLFAIINKAGTLTTNPTSTPTLPDNEIYTSSSGTLSTMWSMTTSGTTVTLNVTPSGSLTETLYGLEYTVEVFPDVSIITP